MTLTLTILLILTILGWIATAVLLWRRRRCLAGTFERCRRTGERVAEFWHDRLNHDHGDDQWADSFAHLCRDLFAADCCLVYREQEKGEAAAWVDVQGAAGTCTEWPAVARSAAHQTGGRELFYWSRRPHVYDAATVAGWAPAEIAARLGAGILAPIAVAGQDWYVFLGREGARTEPFTTAAQDLLVQVILVSEMGLAALDARRQAAALDEALHDAHEQGMLQISTGIVHNIGNAITVIQLAMDRILDDQFYNACNELTGFIVDEVLPELRDRLSQGELETFLAEDPRGRGYLEAVHDIMTKLRDEVDHHHEDLQVVTDKFRTLIEILALQQQFVGELGTENVVKLEPLMVDVGTICRPPVEQLGIDLELCCQASGRILVDPAMLRHILVVLIKHAIDAVAASRRVQPRIGVVAEDADLDGRPWQRLVIGDNGIGCDFDLDDQTTEPVERSAQEDERRGAMLFARQRIQKYGGTMQVASDYANGTQVTILLPVYTAPAPGE